jgi:hypothetical protein
LILKGTSIKVFPLTSISKRFEAGEPVNVRELFAAACSAIRRAANDA